MTSSDDDPKLCVLPPWAQLLAKLSGSTKAPEIRPPLEHVASEVGDEPTARMKRQESEEPAAAADRPAPVVGKMSTGSPPLRGNSRRREHGGLCTTSR